MPETAAGSRPATTGSRTAGARTIAGAAALDGALVLAFAALGRSSHAEAETLTGLAQTAWPFLAGLAIVWALFRVWRDPAAPLRSGVPVWLGTVAFGLLLRVLIAHDGAALPFVLVTTGVLGIFLVGWRALGALIRRLARR